MPRQLFAKTVFFLIFIIQNEIVIIFFMTSSILYSVHTLTLFLMQMKLNCEFLLFNVGLRMLNKIRVKRKIF